MDGTDGLCGQAAPKRWEGLHSELSYKRLEKGRFVWPITKEGSVTLTPARMSMLLEGIDWRAPRKTFTPQLAG
jgi:transposase